MRSVRVPVTLRHPALLLSLAMLLWSGNILLARATHTAFTPTNLSFWRWAGAVTLLLSFTSRGLWVKRRVLWDNLGMLIVLGLLSVTAFNWLLYQAVRTTTATNVALIYTNVPIFIVAVNWAFGERIGWIQALGIGVSMVGVVAIITHGDPAALLHWQFRPGDLWGLSTVPVWGLYTILQKRRPPELTAWEFLAALGVCGLVPLVPLYVWERLQGVTVAWTPATLATAGYLIVVPSLLAFSLWNAGVPGMGANRAGLFTHLYPLFVAGLAIVFLGESLHLYHLAGAALIFGGLALTTVIGVRKGKAGADAPPPEASAGPAEPAPQPMTRGRRRLLGLLVSPYVLLVLNMLFWSGNWIVGRGLRGEITPLGLNFWRWTLVLAWLLPFTWPNLWANRAAIRRSWKVLATMGILAVAVFNLLVYLSVAKTTAINGVLISASTPVAIVVFAWMILKERVTLRQALGIAISFGGVVAIITRGDPALLLHLHFNTGDLWALVSVPVWALYSVLLRRAPPELGPMSLVTVMVIVGVTAMLPFALVAHALAPQVHLSWQTLGGVVYVALFSSLLGIAFFNNGVARLGPNVAGLFIHLVPVFTTGLAWALLGEALALYHALGIALIFGGIYLTTVSGRAAPAAQPVPSGD